MKKTLCLLLCFVMLLSVLVGCKKKDQPTDTTPGDTQPVSDTSDTETTGIRKEMVFEDFSVNGEKRDFLMAVRADRYHYLYAEQDATDRVERATYTRNAFVEEKFGVNIKIKEINSTKADWANQLAVTDGSIDVAVPDYWWLLEQQDLFINLYAREELQFNQEYWYAAWNDGTTINNKLYTVVGDGSLEVWENIEVVFFNKGKATTQGVNLYDLVDNNQWTIDKMLEVSRNAASGLDDSDTTNDIHGALYDVHSMRSQLFSAGLKIVDTSNGTLDIVAQSRTLNLDIVDKVKSLIHDQATDYHASTARSDATNKAKLFTSGKTMFYATALYAGYTINAQTNVPSFGVLPMPKYGTDQEKYITTSYGVSVFAIPKIALDQHFSAVILDAINYYSEEHTLDAFYNKAMRGQLAEGSDDVRMLDLAKDTMYFDMGWILDEGGKFNLFAEFQSATLNNREVNLTSAMTTSTANLAELIAFYNK